jgi:hypothetical protein
MSCADVLYHRLASGTVRVVFMAMLLSCLLLLSCTDVAKDVGRGAVECLLDNAQPLSGIDDFTRAVYHHAAEEYLRHGEYHDALKLFAALGEYPRCEQLFYIFLDQNELSLADYVYRQLKRKGYRFRPPAEVISELTSWGYSFRHDFSNMPVPEEGKSD